MAWFPESDIWECGACGSEVSPEDIGRARGMFVCSLGRRRTTTILRSQCPSCGMRQSLCLEGPWWRTLLLHALWRLRYGVWQDRTHGWDPPPFMRRLRIQ
jgi:hypothetical protein